MIVVFLFRRKKSEDHDGLLDLIGYRCVDQEEPLKPLRPGLLRSLSILETLASNGHVTIILPREFSEHQAEVAAKVIFEDEKFLAELLKVEGKKYEYEEQDA